jgi:sRNA-binding protein
MASPTNPPNPGGNYVATGIVIMLVALGVLAFILWVIDYLVPAHDFWIPGRVEMQMGLFVALAATVLMVVLAAMAIIYQRLGLDNKDQALGLPQGSVRSLIALLLLVGFVIITIYLFRVVSESNVDKIEHVTQAQLDAFKNRLVAAQIVPSKADKQQAKADKQQAKADEQQAKADEQQAKAGQQQAKTSKELYDIWVTVPRNDTATERFAQQIFTALLTLVTAVSSFYFGSRKGEEESSSKGKSQEAAKSQVKVTTVAPTSAQATATGATLITITGAGFTGGAEVELRKTGQNAIKATKVNVVDDTTMSCEIDVNSVATGKWDLVVIRNGKEHPLKDAFEVK